MHVLPLAIAAGVGALLLSSMSVNKKLEQEWKRLEYDSKEQVLELQTALKDGNVEKLRWYYLRSNRNPNYTELPKLIAKRLGEITGNPPR